MTATRGFPDAVLEAVDRAKILGVRSGSDHRHTGVWVVVVERRVFIRSWNDKPTGWYRAFQRDPLGSIRIGEQEIAVRARRTRSQRLRQAVSRAYAEKYDTRASEKWVRGFAEPHRELTTLELVPVA
ncbi:MAG TPA: nitroreductase/quinone reductase family protein [Longimicrobiaceae bacterium]|nr:nitroreductase/quinone reductase family protein [Longimicrobiaceae bacterium]